MNLLTRFRHRSRAERKLLWRTALLFVCAHVLTHQRELRRTRNAMSAIARHLHARAQDPAQLSWAINAVTRHLPGHHSCLISALSCEAIADTSGIPAEFKIGAAHQHGHMHFHAWVEHDGAALTGAHDGEFAPLR
jgi:hypothetical protein